MAYFTQVRLRSLALFVAPVMMLAAIIFHPYLVNELDVEAATAAVMADPTRWAVAHVMLMAAFASIMLAVVALRHLLRTAGDSRLSFMAVPLLIGGSSIFIAVWGFEITVAAVANVGGDVRAVFEESDRWFGPIGIVGYVMFLIGWPIMALAVRRSKVLGRRQTWVVLGSTIVMIAGLSFPSTAGAYLFLFGMMGFTWTLGYNELSNASGLAAKPSH